VKCSTPEERICDARKLLDTLQSQSDKVRSEHALVQRTASDCVSLEVEIIQTSNTFDPNDSAAVDSLAVLRARHREKQNWVAIAPRVRSAISDLVKTLFEAPALVREIAERRAPVGRAAPGFSFSMMS